MSRANLKIVAAMMFLSLAACNPSGGDGSASTPAKAAIPAYTYPAP